jgi:chemotaxis protein CheD
MSDRRTMVRMAEHAVSKDDGAVLVTLGLGSCIGCALIDSEAKVAGLAHIVLPESWANSGAAQSAPPAKFANTAVPHLVNELERLGARKNRLKAVLCGGAHMFSSPGGAKSPALEIGRRNNEETVKALQSAGIPIRASEVGGTKGRSVEVHVASGEVFVRTVGQTAIKL